MADTDPFPNKINDKMAIKVEEELKEDYKIKEENTTLTTEVSKNNTAPHNSLTTVKSAKSEITENNTAPHDKLTFESDQTKNNKKSDPKPKWKLKISIGQSNSSDKNGNEYREEQQKNDSDVEKENDEIDVSTTNEPLSMFTGDSLLPAKRKIKKKSVNTENFSPSQAKKPKGGLRSDCPPFCKANCTFDHHPLLTSARKMIENDSSTTMIFLDIVASYYGGDLGNMDYSDSIDDPWKSTSFPLLHYIALMGKCAGCFAMTDAGHSPETVLAKNGDTVLHTMTREMYTFNCTHGHMDILLKKFNLLLKEFKSCLLITNKSWQTPLHVCCNLICDTSTQLCESSNNRKTPFRLYQFLKNMLLSMLEQFRNDELDPSMLNMTDDKQNTFSHYLARDRASFDILEEIKEMGADFEVCNNENENVEKVMEKAPPGPPEAVIEMAVFSAKGRKYKSLHQKPLPVVKTASMVKTSSPKRQGKPKRIIKPTFKVLSFIESKYTAEKVTEEKPKVLENKNNDDNVDKPNQETFSTTLTKGKARVKITPTRKEKKEQKIAKKLAITAKENVMSETTPLLTPSTTFSTVFPNPSLTLSTSSTNTLTIFTGKQPNPNIAKVKPTIIAPLPALAKTTNHTSHTSKIVIDGKPSKLEISPLSISNNIKPSPIIGNQLNQVPTATLYGPQSLIKSQVQNNQIVASSHADKSIIVKTLSGKVLQLQPKAGDQNTVLPPVPGNYPIASRNNIRMVRIPKDMRFVGNLQQQQQQQSHIRPININGQWIYPSPNLQVQYAQSMHSPPGRLSISNGVFFGPNQVIQSNVHHFQQHQQLASPSMVVGGPPQPAMVNQQNAGPVTVMQPPVNFQMGHFTQGRSKLQPPVFFPPYQTKRAPQLQQIKPQLQQPSTRIDQQLLQNQPYQQSTVTTKSTDAAAKRRGNLEASIRNLQTISMGIISSNNQEKTVPGESPNKSPGQNQPPQPAEESAPPVYIIDTDDEQHIFNEGMINKQFKGDSSQTADTTADPSEPNHKEHIIVEKQKRCKFDVELPYSLCQHFEQFLVVNRLPYSKFECAGHEADTPSSSSPSPNPFLLMENRQPSNRNQGGGTLSKDTPLELLEWFSVNKQRLCMEHFARLIVLEGQGYLEHLLSLEIDELSEEQYKDMIKIEHFLRNRELQAVLSCKCASFDELAAVALHHHPPVSVASSSSDDVLTPSIERPRHNHQHQQRRPYQPPPPHSIPFWEDNLISQGEVQLIAEGLRAWLHHHPWVSQGYFAIHYLNRSQGTISHLLRWATAPTSRQGEEVWLRIKHFLEDKELQETFSIKAKRHKASLPSSSSSSMTSPAPAQPQQQPFSQTLLQEGVTATTKPADNEAPSSFSFPSFSSNSTAPPLPRSDQPKPNAPDNLPPNDNEISQATMIVPDDSHHKPHPGFQPPTPAVSYPPFDPFMSSFTQGDIYHLADRLSQWLYRYPIISQARFSKHVLHRTQGTLSSLLKLRCMPISRAGHEVWHKIRDFLNEPSQQEALLNQYGWAAAANESEREERILRVVTKDHHTSHHQTTERNSSPPPHNHHPSHHHHLQHHHLSLRKRSFPSELAAPTPQIVPRHENSNSNGTSDVPTVSVSPYKVKRLGEFDQDTVSILAEQLKDWLDNQTRVSQGMFAQRVLSRSQGTLSLLLTRKAAPISSSGEEVWRKIREFLHDERQQRDLIHFAYQQN